MARETTVNESGKESGAPAGPGADPGDAGRGSDSCRADGDLQFDTPAECIDFPDIYQVGDDRLKIVHPPRERLEAIEALCARAKHRLRVVLYMIHHDGCGTRVRDALIGAAARGVEVTALFDTFGSNEIDPGFLDPLREAGAQVGMFNARRSLRYLIRNHQKIYVADDSFAIVAGFNATNHYFGCAAEESWEDMGVVIEGPTAATLARYCDSLYDIAMDGRVRLRAVRALVRQWGLMPGNICVLLGGPLRRLSPWARALRGDVRRAQRLDVVSAYFSPGYGTARRMAAVGRRDGARFVLAGRTDNMATIGASRHLYRAMMRRRATIYEFQPCCLHMKLIVVDDITYIGSANLDARSLFINMEIMLRIENAELAAAMRSLIDAMAEQSEEQTMEVYRSKAGWLSRLRWAMAYFATNTLDYTISRKANFGLKA